MAHTGSSTSDLLRRASLGDRTASGRLITILYDELRAIAGAAMQQERADHTLQPTALVHEAYLRMIDVTQVDWNDELHFRALAAESMRRVLVDHARRRNAAKRGGPRHTLTLDGVSDPPASDGVIDLLELDEALEKLEHLNVRHRRVVELRFFGGLTHDQTAKALGVSEQTVRLDWSMARAWLRQYLDRRHEEY